MFNFIYGGPLGVPSPYDGIGLQEPVAAITIYLACGSNNNNNKIDSFIQPAAAIIT